MEENWTVDISLVACKESSFDAHLNSNMEIDVNYIYFGYEFEIIKTGVDSIRSSSRRFIRGHEGNDGHKNCRNASGKIPSPSS